MSGGQIELDYHLRTIPISKRCNALPSFPRCVFQKLHSDVDRGHELEGRSTTISELPSALALFLRLLCYLDYIPQKDRLQYLERYNRTEEAEQHDKGKHDAFPLASGAELHR